MVGWILSSFTILVSVLVVGADLAVSDDYRSLSGIRDRCGILHDTPISDPVSKSYFALIRTSTGGRTYTPAKVAI